jgi:hypothetical protein
MKLKTIVIKRLRDLARDYHAAYLTKRPLNLDDIGSERIKDYLTHPKRKKFKEIVNALSKEERTELLALVWLGRGEGVTLKDGESLIRHARNEDDEGTAEYLIEKALLADYIDKGLAKMEGKQTSGK